MEFIKTGQEWLDRLTPQGLPTRTSTLISGPGGSGKPLIGEAYVAAWLRQGGSTVFMSLQYPNRDFIYNSLNTVTGLDLSDYSGKVAFISLDATIDGMETAVDYHFKANLVLPAIWDAAIEQGCSLVPEGGPGIMVFGSALNLLLFSPTYGDEVQESMLKTIRDDKQRTYMFSVSTSAKKDKIAELEAAADNLIMSRSEKKPFRLYLHIVKIKDVPFLTDEIIVPIPSGALAEIKEVAEHSRKRVIPLISKI
ncbi:MAG: ATPase domain-containing protein [Chloroflexota bacterium]|nr:ATPase domain-containing protein [Chloroflexota bacterium]